MTHRRPIRHIVPYMFVMLGAIIISGGLWWAVFVNRVPDEQAIENPQVPVALVSPVTWKTEKASSGLDVTYPPDFAVSYEGGAVVISYDFVASTGARMKITPSDEVFEKDATASTFHTTHMVPVSFGSYEGYDITPTDAPKNTRKFVLDDEGSRLYVDMTVGEKEHSFSVLVYYQIMETVLSRMTRSI